MVNYFEKQLSVYITFIFNFYFLAPASNKAALKSKIVAEFTVSFLLC